MNSTKNSTIEIDLKLLPTKKDIEDISVTLSDGSCLTWLNSPYCWTEDSCHKKTYRKLIKLMNIRRKAEGKKEIVKHDKK